MKQNWQVETYTICDGWVNCWHVTDVTQRAGKQYFNSFDEAEQALNEHLNALIDNGMTVLNVAELADDYRITRRSKS